MIYCVVQKDVGHERKVESRSIAKCNLYEYWGYESALFAVKIEKFLN